MTFNQFLAALQLPFVIESSPRVRNTVKFDHMECLELEDNDGGISADSPEFKVFRQVQVQDQIWVDASCVVHVVCPGMDNLAPPRLAAVRVFNLAEEALKMAAIVGKEFDLSLFDIDKLEIKFEEFLTNAVAAATQSRPIDVWADKDNTFDAFDANGEKVAGRGQSPTQYFIAADMVVVKVYWGAYETEVTVFGTPNERQLVGMQAIFEKVERARQFQATRGRQIKVTKIGQTLEALW